ncbi:hypothetical protein HY750_00425 [Candidatus Kuenenbacteria bacterium]|nr:hypothetical protein [Candidatus Kuenenbacteria bacterium]
MKFLCGQKINKEIKEDFFYSFETKEGVYLIEIIAKAKSWWQNFKNLKSFLKDDDIILNLDNSEIFTSNSKNNDVKAIWNGNELKGLSKTVIIAINLKKGGHTIYLKPNQNPILESINILELEEIDNNTIVYSSIDNNPPEKGDRRPWINYILQNLVIKKLSILASANKLNKDDEDIKLIIDGKIEKNENKNSHQDWYWCGKILKGKEAIFEREVNFKKGKHFIELWSDKNPQLNKIEVTILPDNNEYNKETIKPYEYKGVLGNEDYNRYDEIIIEVVAFWNNEFLKDSNPPSEPLDPNLVKAIIYQESRIGYYKGADKNVMQVGNSGDPSLRTLKGELKEYWIHNREVILLKYDAKIEIAKDSIYWGVRWLYHKAQGITTDNKRYWRSWREAVLKYGPGKPEYINSIWDIYKKGIKKEKNKTIHLWAVILFFMLMILFLNKSSEAYSLDVKINNQIIKESNQKIENIDLKYSKNKKYFLAQVELEKDWWEDFKVGEIKDKNINWFLINKLPDEQAILSAKFIDLKGFNNSLVEVYGLTHVGHGYLYVYEIKNKELKLLFETEAVDYNSDTRWAPENYKKYGYGNCGEIFSNGKLISKYRDINKDGSLDLILSGTKEIICEEEHKDFKNVQEVKVDHIQIEKIFLWNKNKHTWVDAEK